MNSEEIRKAFEAKFPVPHGCFWDAQFSRYDTHADSDFPFADEYTVRYRCFKAGIEHHQKRIDELENTLGWLISITELDCEDYSRAIEALKEQGNE